MAVGMLSLTPAHAGAVTETFLHETAVSLPQLWRLNDRVPVHGLPMGDNRRARRCTFDVRGHGGADAALTIAVGWRGMAFALNPPPLANAGHRQTGDMEHS
jgi:hypothetical protein